MMYENNVISKDKMPFSTIHVRGWAFIAYAFFNVFLFVVIAFSDYDRLASTVPYAATEVLFSTLLLLGLSSIQFGPSLKYMGRVGLILMMIRPITLLAFFLPLLAPGHYQIQSFLGIPRMLTIYLEPAIYFVPYIGYLLIGWLTINTKSFPKWTGMALVLSGLFYFATNYIGMSQITDTLHTIFLMSALLTEALAFIGYSRSLLATSTSAE